MADEADIPTDIIHGGTVNIKKRTITRKIRQERVIEKNDAIWSERFARKLTYCNTLIL
jgi:hypothetical protein